MTPPRLATDCGHAERRRRRTHDRTIGLSAPSLTEDLHFPSIHPSPASCSMRPPLPTALSSPIYDLPPPHRSATETPNRYHPCPPLAMSEESQSPPPKATMRPPTSYQTIPIYLTDSQFVRIHDGGWGTQQTREQTVLGPGTQHILRTKAATLPQREPSAPGARGETNNPALAGECTPDRLRREDDPHTNWHTP